MSMFLSSICQAFRESLLLLELPGIELSLSAIPAACVVVAGTILAGVFSRKL
jgi:hypothetical protein